MYKNFIALTIATVFALVAFANQAAADPRSDLYIGVGVGASMLHGCEGTNCFNPSSTHDNVTAHDPGFKLFTGYRVDDYLAFELGYYDLGQALDNDLYPDKFDVTGGSLSALVSMPIDEQTRVFIRGGLFVSQIQENDPESDGNNSVNDRNFSGIFGIGAEFQTFSNFSIRGEVEYIPDLGSGNHQGDTGNTANIEALLASVSLVWTPSGLNPERPFMSTGSGLSSLGGLYVGSGIMSTSFSGGEDREEDGAQYFDDVIRNVDIGAKVFAGYRFMKYAAVEAGYHYFGLATDDSSSELGADLFEAQGFSLAAMGILPVSDRASAFIKVGGFYGWLSESEVDNATILEEDGLSYLVGAGMNFDITKNITLRAEVEYVPNVGDGTVGNEDDGIDDFELNETADIDVIASSLNFIWWFR